MTKLVKIELTKKEAETLRDSIADILCWINGFRAARPDDDLRIWGTETLMSFNCMLKDRIDD